MNRHALPLLGCFLLLACEGNKVSPQDAAKNFLTDLRFTGTASCTQWDTTGDGYVTCTVAVDRGSDEGPLLVQISCAPIGSRNAGCKATPEVLAQIMAAKPVFKRPTPSATTTTTP